MKILEENDSFCFWEEERVICYCYKTNTVDIDIARESVMMRYRVTNQSPCVIFADLENIKSLSREARDYYASKEAEHMVNAAAIMAPTVISKIIVTFYLNFNKPKVPVKMFTSKEKAFEWLQGFMN